MDFTSEHNSQFLPICKWLQRPLHACEPIVQDFRVGFGSQRHHVLRAAANGLRQKPATGKHVIRDEQTYLGRAEVDVDGLGAGLCHWSSGEAVGGVAGTLQSVPLGGF